MVEGKYICHSFVQVFGLVEDGLAVKCSELFVEVDSEEVEVSRSGLEDGLVVPEDIVEVVRSLCRDWPDLLVASCVSWYE